MDAQMFWSLAIIVGVTLPLLIGGMIVEVLAPKSRQWIKRLRGIENGRKAMRGES